MQSPEQAPFAQWPDFMDLIYKSDIALYGILNGAKAYTRGEFFLLESPNPTIKEFIKIPTHSKAIKSALLELTGTRYKLGLFKKKDDSAPKRDPLEDLIAKAQGNINIDIK